MESTTRNIVLASLDGSPAALEVIDNNLVLELVDQYWGEKLLRCAIRRIEIPLNELLRIEFHQQGWSWLQLGGKILLQAAKIASIFGTAGGQKNTLTVNRKQLKAAKYLVDLVLQKLFYENNQDRL